MATGDPLEWLAELLSRENEDGALRWTDLEVEDLVAALILSLGFAAGSLPPAIAAVMAAFARRAGISADTPREEIEAHVAAYFHAHPLADDLAKELKRRFRETVLQAQDDLPLQVARILDAAPRRALAAGSPRPPGALPGGALGFFMAREALGGDADEESD